MRKITLGYLNISNRGKLYVNDALDRNRLSRGIYTDRFEKYFASLHQCKHAIFMNSGTSALQVALSALKEVHGYQDGDEVLVPSTTFISTVNIVLQNNLKPVFVDVEPDTFNIDPENIWEKTTLRTRAIIPVHLFGLPADMDQVMSLADWCGLQVIEDSCESMFSSIKDKTVGSFGDFGTFSTYVAHLLTSGVGGLVTTNDDNLATIARSLMAHGRDSIYLSIDDDDNKPNLQTIMERRYSFDRVGYSYRATELEAALALAELERWEENIATRQRNASYLTKLLKPLEEFLQLPYTPSGMTHSFMMFPFVVKQHDRDTFLLYLEENGIETRYMFPLLSQPIYRKLFPGLDDQYQVSKHLAANGAFIGMHQGLTTDDIEYVAETITKYFRSKI